MDSINGLPAHPLFVHAPVVLVPLMTLFALVVAARPALRRRAGWALALAACVALIATQLAVTSGYRFDELIEGAVNTDRHQDLAEASRNLVVVAVLVLTAVVAIDFRARHAPTDRAETAARVTSVLGALVAVAATVWMARAGEEGARLVWSGVLDSVG